MLVRSEARFTLIRYKNFYNVFTPVWKFVKNCGFRLNLNLLRTVNGSLSVRVSLSVRQIAGVNERGKRWNLS